MIKMIKHIILTCLSIVILAEAHSFQCKYYYTKYNILPETKSIRGWKRVIKKHELYKYGDIDNIYHPILEECLIKDGFNIKKYSRTIGGNR